MSRLLNTAFQQLLLVCTDRNHSSVPHATALPRRKCRTPIRLPRPAIRAHVPEHDDSQRIRIAHALPVTSSYEFSSAIHPASNHRTFLGPPFIIITIRHILLSQTDLCDPWEFFFCCFRSTDCVLFASSLSSSRCINKYVKFTLSSRVSRNPAFPRPQTHPNLVIAAFNRLC